MKKHEFEQLLNKELTQIQNEGCFQNPLLDMPGVNIHQDTPMELLHTMLLGVVKYFWGQTVYTLIQCKQFDVFQVQLDSVSTNGLNIPCIMAAYMCQYCSSLIGKHFKTIVQIIPFVIAGLVNQDLLDAWVLLGRLAVLCWFVEIHDLEKYLDELQQVINDFLTKAAVCAPSIIITKPKFHFLVHLPFFIRRNQQAPSRDSAITFAGLDRVKHICSGGYWADMKSKKVLKASKDILKTILACPEYSKFLGFPSKLDNLPGSYKLSLSLTKTGSTRKVAQGISFSQTEANAFAQGKIKSPETFKVYYCQRIIMQSGDVASINSFILISKILTTNTSESFNSHCELLPDNPTVISVNILELEAQQHSTLDFPQLFVMQTVDYCDLCRESSAQLFML
ncbi:hypothetical protein Clacol_007937 [Clathrus columnatus]|uniref:Uncharacterized protein n=1 Tax=Clathrus columnatus TaxID=1419009 RepID=A0AAV5AGB4_9AGAM|nr:hypothetical protein Clacol_007937 [Clathrus columnatus]